MKAAILAIGSELLGTDRLDTNSLRLTEVLDRFGVELIGKAVLGDSVEEIAAVVRWWSERAEILIVTGGLGPTTDDLTRDGISLALGVGQTVDPKVESDIEEKFARLAIPMPEVNRRQAQILDGAEVLNNRRGTAPGQALRAGPCSLYLLPGVPRELEGMIQDHLKPRFELLETAGRRETRVLRIACVPESTVEEWIAPAYAEFGTKAITVLASAGDIKIRVTAAGSREQRTAALSEMEQRIAELAGEALYSREWNEPLEVVVGSLLRGRGATVATAESCTGGLVSRRLTSIAGSSDYFLGGAVTYSDRAKHDLLGVSDQMLRETGAVSEEVARAMATGTKSLFHADFGIGITGIAGPGGGSDEKPVGLVHLALSCRAGRVVHRRLVLPGDRGRVQRLASQWALELLRQELLGARRGARNPAVAEYPLANGSIGGAAGDPE